MEIILWEISLGKYYVENNLWELLCEISCVNIICNKKSWEILCGNNFMGNIIWGISSGKYHGN